VTAFLTAEQGTFASFNAPQAAGGFTLFSDPQVALGESKSRIRVYAEIHFPHCDQEMVREFLK